MITRGYEAVKHAMIGLEAKGVQFVHPRFRDSTLLNWWNVAESHIEFMRNHYLQRKTREEYGVEPYTLFEPMLVHNDAQCILLYAWETPDKGAIPAWFMELTAFPLETHQVLADAADLLESNGIKIVSEGRFDAVVKLCPTMDETLRTMSDRMRLSFKGARKHGLKTVNIPYMDVIDILQSTVGARICLESAWHYLYQYNKDPAAQYMLDSNTFRGAFDMKGLISTLPRGVGIDFALTTFNDEVVGLSFLRAHPERDEMYWLTSHLGRSGPWTAMKSKFNLVYAVGLQLMEIAVNDGYKTFNLGINTFDYKKFFNPELRAYPGLEYRYASQQEQAGSSQRTSQD